MGRYRVTDPASGRTVTLTGDSPPSEQELEEVFSSLGAEESAPAQPAAEPAPTRPQAGASGTWEPTPSLSAALFPSLTAARSGGGEGRVSDIRGTAGLVSDISSGLLRVPAAAGRMLDTRMGLSGNGPQGFRESLGQINRGEDATGKPNIISEMTADPATVPSLAIGTPGIGGLRTLAASGAKAGLTSAALHQGDRFARGQGLDPAAVAAEVAINTAVPLAARGAGAAIKKGVGGVKTILSKFSELDEQALKAASDAETLKAAQEAMKRTGGDAQGQADALRGHIEGMQADEANAVARVNERRAQTLQDEMLVSRPGDRPKTLDDVSAFGAGKRIEGAAQAGMKRAGEKFGRAQDEILIGQGVGKKSVAFGENNQNTFEDAVDNFLSEAGVGKGGKTYGVIGNVTIPPGAVNEIRGMKEVFKTALNTRDYLDQLRLVDNRLATAGPNGGRLFTSGSQEDLAMKGLRARLDDALEQQIARAAGKNKNTMLSLWGAHREAYHKTRQAIETIQDGLGAGTANQEAYFSRIKNIGVDDLKKIAEQAKTNTDVALVWNELRKGFYDNLLAKGITADGMDYKAMKKAWDSMDDDLVSVMMPRKVVAHVEGALARTEPLDFKGSMLADNNRLVGKDRQGLLNTMENAGSKAQRSNLQDLETLDDLLGLEGKDRFSEVAKNMYLGKQMGMTPKGALPLFTGSRTGAWNKGLILGSAAAGAVTGGSGGDVQSGSIGLGAGALAGVMLQSPAGALAAYKLLNQIRKGVTMGERNVARPLARHGLNAGRVTRVLSNAQYGGETER